jgi:hypothetical protein
LASASADLGSIGSALRLANAAARPATTAVLSAARILEPRGIGPLTPALQRRIGLQFSGFDPV